MHRRLTIGEARWPETPDFSAVAAHWNKNSSTVMLGFVWKGYDLLGSGVLSKVDVALVDEQLERNITQFLTPKVRDCMTGYEPFQVEQGVYEFETRVSASAQPPLYDLAFVLKSNPRIMWPMEAKVLRSDGDVGRYVNEITDNFLTCRYAPFSGEGSMLGYLLAGEPAKVFEKIAIKIPCNLEDHPHFTSRNHKTSDHVRLVPTDKSYPTNFRCHHLIIPLKYGQ
ncbi:MAG: hypothetical protein A2X79_05730 [Desulfuromonadaceae bacterium GWB2_53_15]|nr:MAG: hypothetical protein A2X79_05730 [Desulfuromonadaceae bacterium GWB2_53_15]